MSIIIASGYAAVLCYTAALSMEAAGRVEARKAEN